MPLMECSQHLNKFRLGQAFLFHFAPAQYKQFFNPSWDALIAETYPAGPEPKTTTSYIIFLLIYKFSNNLSGDSSCSLIETRKETASFPSKSL